MSVDVSSILSNVNLNALVPSSTDVINNLILGAGTSVVLAGLKSKAGADAMDPLGLFHKDAPPAPPAAVNNPNVVVGPTITASAFSALAPAAQAQLAASGVHIIAG